MEVGQFSVEARVRSHESFRLKAQN